MERLTTFAQFWPFYVSEHSRPATRALHFAGTTLVAAALVTAVARGSAWWLLAAPVLGYGPAWVAHFFIEKNRPATFTYPLWSLRGDLRMWWLIVRGRMGPEVEQARRLYPPRA